MRVVIEANELEEILGDFELRVFFELIGEIIHKTYAR